MLNTSRRTFIKGAAYSSALALSGITALSNLAFAENDIEKDLAINTEIVTLINQTASPVTIDNISGVPISNQNDETVVSIAPGEESSFVVPALSDKGGSANNKNLFISDVMLDGQLAISSEYPEFNGVYPASFFAT